MFDSSKMKQHKVNSCFNGRRQQERVFDARDDRAQPGAEKRGEILPGGRESSDVRVVDAFSRAGSEVREAPGERRRADMPRDKPGFMVRGDIRKDSKDRRNDHIWGEEREVVKDKIHVNGIPPEVGERELGEFFSAFGRYGCLYLFLFAENVRKLTMKPLSVLICTQLMRFHRVTHVVIIPVYGFGSSSAQQRFFPPRLRYGFVTFQREAVVQQILKVVHLIYACFHIETHDNLKLQKEALVLRGYKLHVSPAKERRFEVRDRQHSEVY